MSLGMGRRPKSKLPEPSSNTKNTGKQDYMGELMNTKKGGLHDALGIPRGEKLTASEKEPKPGDSSHVKHMKASAKGFER